MVTAGDLTRAEKLRLVRKRNKWTQPFAAKEFGAPLSRYRAWEKGKGNPPENAVGKLTPGEECWILRRRAGLTVRELAAKVGVCPYWIYLMEANRAPVDRLRDFWAKRAA